MERKYPTSMFIVGFLIYLLRMRIFLLLAIIMLVVQFFIPRVPVELPLAILVGCIIVALVRQISDKNALMTMNPNPETSELLDKMFADNNKGARNITDAVDEIIARQEGEKKPPKENDTP
jgi:hypothetical protein